MRSETSGTLETLKKMKARLRKMLGTVYRFVRNRMLYDGLMAPWAKAQHRHLRLSSERKGKHLFTVFYRAPLQLQALTGPVCDFLRTSDSNQRLRLVIFGGSTGAEAYTLASELMTARPGTDFVIESTDLHEDVVEKGRAGFYSKAEIRENPNLPEEFVDRTFELVHEGFLVRSEIRDRVEFTQANILDSDLADRFEPADVVLAQNVLFHLTPAEEDAAFRNVAGLLKPRSALFVDGMGLDLKMELTREMGLEPLDFQVRKLYHYSRRYLPPRWWHFYYGREPYSVFTPNRLRRYSTIFLKNSRT